MLVMIGKKKLWSGNGLLELMMWRPSTLLALRGTRVDGSSLIRLI